MSSVRVPPVKRPIISDARRIAMVLGIDENKVVADSLTLEPFGSNWIVRWEGAAVLNGDAARDLFDNPERAKVERSA